MLQCKIMQYATLFTNEHVIKELREGQYDWLEKAVLQVRSSSGKDVSENVGLCMCMIALQGAAASHVHTFVSDLAEEDRKICLGQLKSKLECLYKRDGVRQWIIDHPDLIDPESLRLAAFLEKHTFLDDIKYL